MSQNFTQAEIVGVFSSSSDTPEKKLLQSTLDMCQKMWGNPSPIFIMTHGTTDLYQLVKEWGKKSIHFCSVKSPRNSPREEDSPRFTRNSPRNSPRDSPRFTRKASPKNSPRLASPRFTTKKSSPRYNQARNIANECSYAVFFLSNDDDGVVMSILEQISKRDDVKVIAIK